MQLITFITALLTIASQAYVIEPPNTAFYELNEYRVEHELPEFKIDSRLCDGAQKRADYLNENNLFNHDGFKKGHKDNLKNYRYTFIGENLARYHSDESLINAWRESKIHNDLMLNDRFKTGCIVRSGDVVVLWLTN